MLHNLAIAQSVTKYYARTCLDINRGARSGRNADPIRARRKEKKGGMDLSNTYTRTCARGISPQLYKVDRFGSGENARQDDRTSMDAFARPGQ